MNTQLSTAARVGGFLLALAVVFGLALAVGNSVGAVGEPAEAHSTSDADHGSGAGAGHDGDEGHQASSSATDASADTGSLEVPGGLMNTQDGYTLELVSHQSRAGTTRPVTFVVTGPDGKPVTSYQREHDKDLHFIAVRRDLTGFQHVHPTLDGDGTWRTELDLTPGQWRTFADFTPAGGEALTLGADLSVPGGFTPTEPSAEKRTARVDGYTVTLAGDLVGGEHSSLKLRVSRDGRPVTDLQPYLGAYGHLVALRSGDLAYLHVHPGGEPDDGKTEPGPEIAFDAEVPSTGVYHLYLDFKHGDVVRTAQFRLETTPTSSTAGHTGSEGHGDH